MSIVEIRLKLDMLTKYRNSDQRYDKIEKKA